MSQAILNSRGQVTIPKAVRDRLGLKAGDRVNLVVNDSGEIVIWRASLSFKDVQGMLAHHGLQVRTVAEMDQAVRQRLKDQST